VYEIKVLGSSSSGNCIYVSDGETNILLDCGLTFKNTKVQLHALGIKLSSIHYILVTHEHIDHIRSVKKMVDDYGIKIIGSRGTLQSIDINSTYKQYIKDRTTINIGTITLQAYRINHDATEPLCFSLTNSLDEKLLYLTDCGMAKYLKFKDYDVYIIEANYSLETLEENYNNNLLHKVRYERALSGMGHLSINETIEFLKRNMGSNTQKIILSHLSSENSNKESFLKAAKSQLSFDEVYIAEEGFNINCGTINPF